jgi:hypothetical protein
VGPRALGVARAWRWRGILPAFGLPIRCTWVASEGRRSPACTQSKSQASGRAEVGNRSLSPNRRPAGQATVDDGNPSTGRSACASPCLAWPLRAALRRADRGGANPAVGPILGGLRWLSVHTPGKTTMEAKRAREGYELSPSDPLGSLRAGLCFPAFLLTYPAVAVPELQRLSLRIPPRLRLSGR